MPKRQKTLIAASEEELADLQKALEAATIENEYLKLATARFEDLFHGVPFACFTVDADGTVYEWNEAASSMLDIEAHLAVQSTIFDRGFCPESAEQIRQLVKRALAGRRTLNVELEAVVGPDHRFLLANVFPLRAARKVPTAALIACADITVQKRLEEESRRSEDQVRTILSSICYGFVALDNDYMYRYVNASAAKWIGVPQDELVGKCALDLCPYLKTNELLSSKIRQVIETGEQASFECHFDYDDAWLEYRVYPTKEGPSIFYNDITERKLAEAKINEQQRQLEDAMAKLNESAILLDLQRLELEEANKNLQRLATTDSITGLLNHRAMQDEVATIARQTAEKATSLSVGMLDVDNFKAYNDSFGHQAGDAVLEQLGEILRSSVREGDVVARYGGEEFCLILPDTEPATALLACDRIRRTVEGAEWPHRQITVSIGVSTGHGEVAPHGLIEKADQALYDAKAAGRNRVCAWVPTTPARCA